MNEDEKEAVNGLKHYVDNIETYNFERTQGFQWVRIALNLIENQQQELNNLKEIEKSHQDENGKLRVEFEKVYEDNLTLAKELEQEKEKNKELEEKLKIATAMLTKGTYPEKNEGDNDFDKNFIVINKMEELNKKFVAVDKIKEIMEQTKKVYDEEMKPYMIEVGNGEKVLNVTYLSKKEKEELINKRNCLLVQIKTYEMLLEGN
jgi:hypothetical protein